MIANPLLQSWYRRGKVALGGFDVAAGEGGTTLVKGGFRAISVLREIFQQRISQKLFRSGIVPLQHGEIPPRQASVSVKLCRNLLQNFSASRGTAVSKDFQVSKLDFSAHGIRLDFENALETGSRSS